MMLHVIIGMIGYIAGVLSTVFALAMCMAAKERDEIGR